MHLCQNNLAQLFFLKSRSAILSDIFVIKNANLIYLLIYFFCGGGGGGFLCPCHKRAEGHIELTLSVCVCVCVCIPESCPGHNLAVHDGI